MNTKIKRVTLGILLSMLLISLLFCDFALAEGFDVTYTDPTGDVEDWEGSTYPSGYEYIDITEVTSSENVLGTQLILEMTVSGLITDSEIIYYNFYLMDGEEWIYMISYSNGICTGYNYETGDEDILQASGAGTSTLEVRVQINNLGSINKFDFQSEASENDFENDIYRWDSAPDYEEPDWDDDYWYYDNNLMITNPREGSTLSRTKTIEGTAFSYYDNITSVEIQIDSEFESGW